MNQSAEQWETAKAKELLDELNGMVGSHSPGPRQYRDWNLRASMLLTFAACRRLATDNQLFTEKLKTR